MITNNDVCKNKLDHYLITNVKIIRNGFLASNLQELLI